MDPAEAIADEPRQTGAAPAAPAAAAWLTNPTHEQEPTSRRTVRMLQEQIARGELWPTDPGPGEEGDAF